MKPTITMSLFNFLARMKFQNFDYQITELNYKLYLDLITYISKYQSDLFAAYDAGAIAWKFSKLINKIDIEAYGNSINESREQVVIGIFNFYLPTIIEQLS